MVYGAGTVPSIGALMGSLIGGTGAGGISPAFLSLIKTLFIIMLVIFLAVYVYTAMALMTIAKKTKTKRAWLAWIPIANIYLMTKIAKVPWWTMLLLLLCWIPVGGYIFGYILMLALTIYWWWNIAKARKMHGWLGILMAVPLVNLIVMGIIAWRK